MILCNCAKYIFFHSIINFKNTPLIPESSFLSASRSYNLTTILITKIKHQKQPFSKEDTIEFKHKSALFSSFSLRNPYIFRTLYNSCIYSRAIFRTKAHLESAASSKICETYKMIRHIQSRGIVRRVYLSVFQYIEGYWAMLMHIQPHSQMRN